MSRFQVINHKGKEIICLDFSKLTSADKAEMKKSMEEAKKAIAAKPPKSALVITNISGTGFDLEVSNAFKEYASHNTPYVKASAVVGAEGLQKVILSTIKTLTGRDYHLVDTMEQAKEWLTGQ